MNIETELKLIISSKDIEKLQQHPLLQQWCQTPSIRSQLTSIYYDTPDDLLLHHGFILRIRKMDDSYSQTIKSANVGQGQGLSQRSEWYAEAKGFTPNISAIPDLELRQLVLERTSDNGLQPLFTTDFERTTWLLTPTADVKVELALDQGEILAGEKSAIIQEVELELLQGTTENLFEIAKLLAADLDLKPEDESKAERGYSLLRGKK